MNARTTPPRPLADKQRPTPMRAIHSRKDLSFTRRNEQTGLFENWSVPHDPQAYWGNGVAIGRNLFEEVEALAGADELEAFYAILTALMISPEWRTNGAGIETGFTEALAAVAILGIRAVYAGADRYDFEAATRRRWEEEDAGGGQDAHTLAALASLEELLALADTRPEFNADPAIRRARQVLADAKGGRHE